jgi:hypothetical protein
MNSVPTPTTNCRQITQGMNVVALAGRRIDAVDTPTPRFPLDNAPMVQERIRAVLQETEADVLVSSAACGADLLALGAAHELGVRVHVVLPFARERFRQTSVIDRPGDWGALFDQYIQAAEQERALYELESGPDSHEGYLRALDVILDLATDCAHSTSTGQSAPTPGEITAVAVWDGQSRGPRDITVSFLKRAGDRGIMVRHVPTG